MTKKNNKNNQQTNLLYNSILLLSRNKLFYTKFDLIDTFQNRIHLIFIHASFIFIKNKQSNKSLVLKNFSQKLFDHIFAKIEINMREIGFSDTSINKSMKSLIKTFYNILLNCEKYNKMAELDKITFINTYLAINNINNTLIYNEIIMYFDKYKSFCFDLSPDSVLRGEINFNFK